MLTLTYHRRIVLSDAAVRLDDLPAREVKVHLPVQPRSVPSLPTTSSMVKFGEFSIKGNSFVEINRQYVNFDVPGSKMCKYLTTEPIPDLLLSHPQLRPLLRAQPLVAVHREVVALIVDHLN